jgi:TMEM175 potassium channel family protein
VFLALIALMPFSSELVDRYDKEPIAAAVFGATLGFAALAHLAMARHALSGELFHEEARRIPEPFGGATSLTLGTIFLLSVPIAYLSTLLAHLMWLSAVVVRYPLRRLAR